MTNETSLSATELLRQRHEEIKALFDQTFDAQGAARSETFDCLRAALAVHETVEEMFVHPLARSISDEADTIVLRRLEEENEAKRTLADLEKLTPEGDGFGPALKAFQQAVLRHAEAEEREVFPLIDRECSENALTGLADAIRAAEHVVPTHPHPHAGENPIALMLVGPFAGMLDRARDVIKEVTRRAS